MSMGTSTMAAACGCVKTRLLEPEEDVWVTWRICAEHYRGEEDDRMVLAAAANQRRAEEADRQFDAEQARRHPSTTPKKAQSRD